MNDFKEWFENGGFLLVIFAIAILSMLGSSIKSAAVEAKVINKATGSNYSTSDMFWSGNTIKKILEGEQFKIKIEHTQPNPSR